MFSNIDFFLNTLSKPKVYGTVYRFPRFFFFLFKGFVVVFFFFFGGGVKGDGIYTRFFMQNVFFFVLFFFFVFFFFFCSIMSTLYMHVKKEVIYFVISCVVCFVF